MGSSRASEGQRTWIDPEPSVPMKVRHLAPGNLDLRALKDNHAHAHAGEAD